MIRPLFLVLFFIRCALARNGNHSKPWQTLDGVEPVVIARGGYSGLFPDSSKNAILFAKSTSLDNVITFCDLQLTKDDVGLCLTGLDLGNSTTISEAFPDKQKFHNVNGKNVRGWFASDYTDEQLVNQVSLIQNIFSRTNVFDNEYPISAVDDAIAIASHPLWLNIQYPSFYTQQKKDPALYIQKVLKSTGIDYISSPEIGFLKALNGKVNKAKTKLVFQFLEKDTVEPTTNQTYGSILQDLSSVVAFASGILIPKEYIWPVTADQYLESATSVVTDAHKQGLRVYASGFANDNPGSFNYSYDPTAEYLQFIDNSQFSVDGVLTDFPSTASGSIACLAHNKNGTRSAKGPLIISHNGASGIFPGCSDLAYERAIADGADIIDCTVQMSKDGVAFCLESSDLSGETNALSTFLSRSTKIPEIKKEDGIFSFDLSWSEIQTLKPQMVNPFIKSGLKRNPANMNKGKFVTLSAFLELAQTKAVTGILINIQNAAYLASKKGIIITDVVAAALTNATFNNQRTQKVLIQSDDTQVLSKFKNNPNYQKVLFIDEAISAAPKPTVDEIKKYADAVSIKRESIIKGAQFFASSFTNVVGDMHAANISVYVVPFRNEFVSMAFDFFADPMVELATFLGDRQVDGVITDFPATANAYLRSPCSNLNNDLPYTILPIQPGALLDMVPQPALPPAEAPAPVLGVDNIVDPPLQDVVSNGSASTPTATTVNATAPSEKSSSGGAKSVTSTVGVQLLAMLLASVLYVGS